MLEQQKAAASLSSSSSNSAAHPSLPPSNTTPSEATATAIHVLTDMLIPAARQRIAASKSGTGYKQREYIKRYHYGHSCFD